MSPETQINPEIGSNSRDPARSPRATVIRHVHELLRTGAVRPGEPVPSERALTRELDVHRDTVRGAIRVLQDQGLLRKQANGRCVVQGVAEAARKTNRAGVTVCMPDLSDDHNRRHLQSGWAERIGQGAVAESRRTGRSVTIMAPGQLNESGLTEFRIAPPRGLLIADLAARGEVLDRIAELAPQLTCPVVAYGSHPRWAKLDRVVSDHRRGAALLYEWLWQRGRRRIMQVLGPMSSETQPWMQQRIAGYREAAARLGSDYDNVIHIPERPAHARRAGEAGFLDDARHLVGHLAEHLAGPHAADAIMCPSDGQAITLAAACRLLHLEPGEDVVIVGYDNYWRDVPSRKFEPYAPPVTVDKRNAEMGAAMVRLLQDRLDDELPDEPAVRRIDPVLVETDETDADASVESFTHSRKGETIEHKPPS